MNYLVVIPARGGSKGIPGKNIRSLNGKPLIHYTIEAARAVFDDKEIVVSTDSVEIKESAERTGLHVPFLRPDALATDNSGTYEVLLHAVDFYESRGESPEVLVLLQPTSPFRNAAHIREALQLYNPGLDMVVSVAEAKANPYYNLFEENQHGFLEKSKTGSYTRRQDCPKVYEYNGAIYIINIASLKKRPLAQFEKVSKFVMDDISSHDLDSQLDWMIAENLMK